MRDVRYVNDFFSITYTPKNDFLHVDWIGFQSETSVHEGCEKMLNFLVALKISKVLNDNTNVKGQWNYNWVAHDWFPRIMNAGLKKFAWVTSLEPLSAELANKTINKTVACSLIQTFSTKEAAIEWLNNSI